ncbi:MAG: type III pantothenate kinase [Vulcanimicrobiaceae bacterium]
MFLGVDVGNSETKLGFFDLGPDGGYVLRKTWRVTTDRRRTADEFGVVFATLLARAEIELETVGAIGISSVVPQSDRALAEACREYFGCEPAFFSAAKQSLMEVTIERPKELGSDLLLGAVAAKRRYGTPLIVVGFGTATTYGAVSREGEYIGTAIAPGLQISIDALVARTAKLPQVALEAPNGPIGRDTVSSMQAGIIFGFVGQTEGIVARMRHAIGEDAGVVATGGLAEIIARHTGAIDAVEPDLVLLGLCDAHVFTTKVAPNAPSVQSLHKNS